MGANRLNLPPLKTLATSVNELAPSIAALNTASRGKKAAIKPPAKVAAALSAFPALVSWIGKSGTAKAYEKLLAAQQTTETTTTAPRKRSAGSGS
jgi:hypothetical protein